MYPGSSPSTTYPSAGAVLGPHPPCCSTPIVVIRCGDVGLSPPVPFSVASPSSCVYVFYFLERQCRLFLFPVRVSPVLSPRVVQCSPRWVWGVTLAHCPRHWQETQARAALRHSHLAVLHVNVGPHLQQVSTSGQAKCTGSVV